MQPLTVGGDYRAFRHYLEGVTEWENDTRGVISMFKSNNLLSNPDKWLYSLQGNQFNRVVRALRAVFGENSNFLRIEKSHSSESCLVVTNLYGAEARTPLDAVSSGFRSILALMCDVTRWLMDPNVSPEYTDLPDARAIVLIDEVEAHLHPRWKLQVMDGLRAALPNVTFIATSHDPLCLRGMNNGEVRVLTRTPVSGRATSVIVEQLPDLPNVTELTVEQLLTSDFFGLFDIDDPMTSSTMLSLTDMLIRRKGLSDQIPLSGISASAQIADQELFRAFQTEIKKALPIGRSDVARLVQEAVIKYLLDRRDPEGTPVKKLRQETVDKIQNILRDS